MSELAFPLLGALVVFLVVVPAATILAKIALVLRRRAEAPLPRHGSNAGWLLIVAPVVAPVPWFVSAAVHQSETGAAVAACLNDHVGTDGCSDALAFALTISLALLCAFARRARREILPDRRRGRPVPAISTDSLRLRSLCASNPRLRTLRVTAVQDAAEPVCTRGMLRPRVLVSVDLMRSLDDEALVGALLHEAEHVHALDPLRYLIASVCLSLNPAAALLRSELRRWRLAREAGCDEGAVRAGSEPLSLAHAIVAAARPASGGAEAWAASLGDSETDRVRVRVGLLLGYAERHPAPRSREAPALALSALLTLAVVLPHILGSGPLDSLHLGIEQTLLFLGLP